GAGIEIAGVELLGGGRHRVLRITIDRSPAQAAEGAPGGVTHADCEFISQNVGTILDVEDVIPGAAYTLEVSSPGVERPLRTAKDFERFIGKKVKIVLREPVENQKNWAGALKSFSDGIVTIEPKPGAAVSFRLDQVARANLKFEW